MLNTNFEQDIYNMENPPDRAKALLELGITEAFRKNFDKAIEKIEQAQKIYNEIKNVRQIAACLAELALIHYKNCPERLIRSLTLLNDAKYLLENLDTKDKTEVEAQILHYYGIIYFLENRYSDALKYYKHAQSLINRDNTEYAKILDSLAVFYLRTNNHNLAVDNMKQSLKIKKTIGNLREIATTELLLGRYHSNIEHYEDSRTYLLNAVETIEKLGDFQTSARIRGELAKVYFELEEYENARKNALKSVKIAQKHGLQLIAAFSHCIIANISIKNNDFEEALQTIQEKTEPIFEEFSSQRGQGLAKQIKALAYEGQGQMRTAIESLSEAIDLFTEAECSVETAKALYKQGVLFKKCSDFPKAASCLKQALSITRSGNLFVLGKKIEDLLFEVDEKEWSDMIDKTAGTETFSPEGKVIIDTVSTIGDLSGRGNKASFLALLKIGRSIAAETDLDRLLTIIAKETQKALSADRCTVFLLDREKNELWSKIALGMGSQEIRFPMNTGIAGHVATTGETINIQDAYNDPRFNKEIDKKTGYKTKTILCMPMRNLDHEITGVFQVLNKLGNEHFTTEDEDLLVAIGSSTGIALENARLFKKQQVMYDEQKRSFISFINTLAASIDARDKITAGHSKRVTMYSIEIAKSLGIQGEELEALEHAALLHDIGKIGIRDSILCKQGKLTEEEYSHIQKHANITYEILNNMYFEEKLKDVPEIAASHHEKIDGTGYFRGLKGDSIYLGGRILAVSDVFDAITSKRHYRDRMPFLEVMNILKNGTGVHFDANIMTHFFNLSLFNILSILLFNEEECCDEKMRELLSKYTLEDFYNILIRENTGLTEEESRLMSMFMALYNPHTVE